MTIFLTTACGALFPVFGQYIWNDTSHPPGNLSKISYCIILLYYYTIMYVDKI